MHTVDEDVVEYYDAANVEALPWSSAQEGEVLKNIFNPLIKNGVCTYISNIETEVAALKVDNLILPITINDSQYENSYVCSPYGQYISYALDSLFLVENQFLRNRFKSFLHVLGKYARQGQLNKVVIVNNWLVSTSLYPKIDSLQLSKITRFLLHRFPDHAIVFRSLDARLNKANLESLKELGYTLIASRQIFMTDTKSEEIFETRIFKSDLRLLKKCGYEIAGPSEIKPDEIPWILKCYHDLYIAKHSFTNPQFTPEFLKLAMENQFWTFKALKKNGIIEGIFGYYSRFGVMSSPFFGYNMDNPEHKILYRILCTLLMLEAKERGLILHQSSGASFYKKIRRAEPCMEYTAVFCKHLPLSRRMPWQVLRAIDNTIGTHFMKKY